MTEIKTATAPKKGKGNSKKTTTVKTDSIVIVEKPDIKVLTIAQLHQALMNANQLYIARNKSPVLNKNGIHESISAAYTALKGMTDVHLREVAEMGLNDTVLRCLSDASNIKKTKRICQSLMFTLTGNGQYLQMSAKGWFLGYVGGIVAGGAKNKQGIKYAMGAQGDEHTSDQLKSVDKANRIMRAFEKLGKGSVNTCFSVTFSKGGIAEALQCAMKDSRYSDPIPNPDSPIIKKLDAIVSKATDGYIELIAAQAGK
jgi:hypothetical protein